MSLIVSSQRVINDAKQGLKIRPTLDQVITEGQVVDLPPMKKYPENDLFDSQEFQNIANNDISFLQNLQQNRIKFDALRNNLISSGLNPNQAHDEAINQMRRPSQAIIHDTRPARIAEGERLEELLEDEQEEGREHILSRSPIESEERGRPLTYGRGDIPDAISGVVGRNIQRIEAVLSEQEEFSDIEGRGKGKGKGRGRGRGRPRLADEERRARAVLRIGANRGVTGTST